jgi:L-asparaginase II
MSQQQTLNHTPTPHPLVEVWRGPIIESRHRGHLIVVDGDGNTIASLGEPETVTFLRSSAKPFQNIPLVVSGAADRCGFSEKEIALACASHNGEPEHVEAARSMLRKIALDESKLKCGPHEPFGAEAARILRESEKQPSQLHNNCSGKHIAMLALAQHFNASIETYNELDHPVQQAIIKIVSKFSDVSVEEMAFGVDGCSAAIFAIPIRAMALMYARLVLPPKSLDDDEREACRRIVSAMNMYPEMIGGGLNERLDTEVMRAARGALVSKVGAEGVYTAGALPCPKWKRGLGIAFKIEDGEDRRARPVVVIETLRQLGILSDDAYEALKLYAHFPICNHAGDTVGEVRANFELNLNRKEKDSAE